MNIAAIIASVVALVIIIILSNKFKLPLGIMAMAAAFIVGYFFLNIAPNKVVAQWPVNSIFTMITATMFFGLFTKNGTMEIIGKSMVGIIKGNMKLFPFVAMIVYAIVSFAVGASATFSIGPILYSMGIAGGVSPAMICLTLGFASMIGSTNPWTGYGGIIVTGHVQANGFENYFNVSLVLYAVLSIVCIIIIVLCYFVFGCFKLKNSDAVTNEKMLITPEQKKSITIVVIAFAAIIIPAVLSLIFPKVAFIKALSTVLNTQIIFTVGTVITLALGIGSMREATQSIPMPVVLLTAGMTMLIFVLREADVTTLLGNALNSGIPSFFIPAVLVIISAIMSFFSSSVSVVVPLFFPVAIQLASVTGANPVTYMACVYVGAMASACSPMSGSGINHIAVAPSEVQDKLSKQMLAAAIIIPIAVGIIASLGLIDLLCSIMGGPAIAF